MQFTSILLAAIASTAFASPVAQPEAGLEARAQDVQLIDLWQKKDFLDLKFTGSSTVGTCVSLGGTGFEDKVRSGKSKPGFRCTIWVDRGCLGTGFSFNAADGAASFPDWIDRKASSWKCVKA